MKDQLIQKIIRKTGIPDLLRILGDELTPAEWHSLLMAISARRAGRLRPAQVLQRYESSRFVKPVQGISSARLLSYIQTAHQLLPPHFEVLSLSPVAPFGSCSGLAAVHQDKVLSAGRNLEVLADATNLLALEASLRRRASLRQAPKSIQQVHLATSHRHVRAQAPEHPDFTAHFQVQCMISAGRDLGDLQFEKQNLFEHISYYIRLLTRANPRVCPDQLEVRLTLLAPSYQAVYAAVADGLSRVHPKVKTSMAPERQSGRGYYQGCCFDVKAQLATGQMVSFCDGGFTDWTSQLLASRKERLLISGFGTELWLRLCQNLQE